MARFIVALGFVLSLAGAASADPPTVERPHEILSERPSGFWTSNRPAVGGAYKYRLLGIGVVIAAITGFFTYRLIKTAKGPIDHRNEELRAKLLAALPEHRIDNEVVVSADRPMVVIINSSGPRTKP